MKLYEKSNASYTASFQPADEVILLQSGTQYFDFLNTLLFEAKESIHLHTYIFEPDATGNQVATALLDAVARGVEVSVVVDGFGSGKFPNRWVQQWSYAGIQIRRFSKISLFKNLNIGRRLHHKVIVVDDAKALVGGINIADKYKGSVEEVPWLDFALYLEGNIAKSLRKICDHIEERSFPVFSNQPPPKYHGQNIAQVNIRQNDWLRNKKQIHYSYWMAFQKAEKSITLFASYFLPGRKLIKALEKASKRGVRIRLILAGKSDIPVFLNASLYLYDWLLQNKVELYEWNHSVMHAKLAMVDDEWMTVGSFNLNHLSTYASIELNTDVFDPVFVKSCSLQLSQLIEESCTQVGAQRPRNWLRKAAEFLAYLAGRTLIKFITFFPAFRKNSTRPID